MINKLFFYLLVVSDFLINLVSTKLFSSMPVLRELFYTINIKKDWSLLSKPVNLNKDELY